MPNEDNSLTMPIKAHSQGLDSLIEEIEARAKRVAIRRLCYIGEQVVNKARSLPTPPQSLYWDAATGSKKGTIPRHQPNYIDWTANLRSSIGYVVVCDGQVQRLSDFEPTKASASEGSNSGRSYAERLAAGYPSGLVLIVVAGMNYAAYVQRKGYDVTASAELLAEKLLKEIAA